MFKVLVRRQKGARQCSLLVGKSNFWKRCYGSVLYVTGDEANKIVSVLTPHLDFDERFKERLELEKSVKLRGMEHNVNEIKKLWDVYKHVVGNQISLENKRIHITEKIKELKRVNDDKAKSEIDKLRFSGKLLREDLKRITKGVWEMEKKAVLKTLSLPNNLHPDTPATEAQVIHECGIKPDGPRGTNHVEIGEKMNILKYFGPSCYYLRGDAALYELGVQYYFANQLRNLGFLQYSNTDFARSVIVEGCGVDHADPGSVFILRDTDEVDSQAITSRLHLVGGASLLSFCANHAKHIFPSSSLPSKCFTVGRHYSPVTGEHGLFNTWQSSAVELFVVVTDSFGDMMCEFDGIVDLLIGCYEGLGYHFRVAYMPARQLRCWESLRASVQVFSPHLGVYVEVGSVSLSDDFVSKRLLMCCDGGARFVRVVSGTAVSVPKLLGCALELKHSGDLSPRLHVPDPISQHIQALV